MYFLPRFIHSTTSADKVSLRPTRTLAAFTISVIFFEYDAPSSEASQAMLIYQGTTIPNLAGTNGTDLVNAHWNNFVSYVEDRRTLASLLQLDFIWILIYQPLPALIATASARINPAGNLLNLSPNSGDHMWMACSVAWKLSLDDSDASTMGVDIIDNIASYTRETYPGVKPSNFKAGYVAPPGYDLIFMNDASADQPVLQGYGDAIYQRLKFIQKKYDQKGVFPQRTNGFKLT